MARILVTDPLDPAAAEALRKAGHEVEARKLSPDELLREIPHYEALLVRSETKVTKAVLGVADKLKVVGRAGVGVDNIDIAAAKERGVAVVNAPLAASNAVAELTLAHMLALARQIPRADASTKEGKWEKKSLMGIELQGRTLGLLGVGRIGGRVAELCKAFGMRVVVYDPYVDAARAKELGVEKVETPGDVVEVADFVSVHVPLTPETKHLVNADLLKRAKKGSYFLNVARGGVIDEKALHDAIKSGHVGGAGLDTFEVEPLKESPLASLPNVVFTPHLGASTHEAQSKAGLMVAEQVRKVLAGEKAEFRVV
ncbi:MAG TPA: hydroxyacid dehydrogenase [Candidatus Thermoplasmatota archaeon]|nr:hydroxyacid dehydrogenase [Candidatus Thermoplasmatota archaeon]